MDTVLIDFFKKNKDIALDTIAMKILSPKI